MFWVRSILTSRVDAMDFHGTICSLKHQRNAEGINYGFQSVIVVVKTDIYIAIGRNKFARRVDSILTPLKCIISAPHIVAEIPKRDLTRQSLTGIRGNQPDGEALHFAMIQRLGRLEVPETLKSLAQFYRFDRFFEIYNTGVWKDGIGRKGGSRQGWIR